MTDSIVLRHGMGWEQKAGETPLHRERSGSPPTSHHCWVHCVEPLSGMNCQLPVREHSLGESRRAVHGGSASTVALDEAQEGDSDVTQEPELSATSLWPHKATHSGLDPISPVPVVMEVRSPGFTPPSACETPGSMSPGAAQESTGVGAFQRRRLLMAFSHPAVCNIEHWPEHSSCDQQEPQFSGALPSLSACGPCAQPTGQTFAQLPRVLASQEVAVHEAGQGHLVRDVLLGNRLQAVQRLQSAQSTHAPHFAQSVNINIPLHCQSGMCAAQGHQEECHGQPAPIMAVQGQVMPPHSPIAQGNVVPVNTAQVQVHNLQVAGHRQEVRHLSQTRNPQAQQPAHQSLQSNQAQHPNRTRLRAELPQPPTIQSNLLQSPTVPVHAVHSRLQGGTGQVLLGHEAHVQKVQVQVQPMQGHGWTASFAPGPSQVAQARVQIHVESMPVRHAPVATGSNVSVPLSTPSRATSPMLPRGTSFSVQGRPAQPALIALPQGMPRGHSFAVSSSAPSPVSCRRASLGGPPQLAQPASAASMPPRIQSFAIHSQPASQAAVGHAAAASQMWMPQRVQSFATCGPGLVPGSAVRMHSFGLQVGPTSNAQRLEAMQRALTETGVR